MSLHLDSIDAEIITLLQEDGRMSSSEIVRRMQNVTERIVRHRIKRMVEEGIIHIAAFIQPEALGYQVTADVWIETDASCTTDVARALTNMEQVSYLSYSTGDQNISMQVHAADMADLHHLVSEVVGQVPGVRRTTIKIIPVRLKDIHQWHIPASKVND